MPVVLAAAALCLSPSAHDGDTIRCGCERVRIVNIDAP
jgi:micrococcal nuclease